MSPKKVGALHFPALPHFEAPADGSKRNVKPVCHRAPEPRIGWGYMSREQLGPFLEPNKVLTSGVGGFSHAQYFVRSQWQYQAG